MKAMAHCGSMNGWEGIENDIDHTAIPKGVDVLGAVSFRLGGIGWIGLAREVFKLQVECAR